MESHVTHAAPATRSGSILVVEDDPAVREMTSALLERAGYDVTVVGDGSEALAAADRLDGRIDVLVTDVAMPGVSGIEVAQRMLARSPKVGVVLLSGYTGETLELARMTTEGAIFVGKPVTSAQLLAAIARAMADREAVVS
jgi:CheY-like chemotaxis protein